MSFIEQLLADQAISNELKKHSKLLEYINYYSLNSFNDNEMLKVSSTLNRFLLPGLLAYDAYKYERDIFFKKGIFTWKFRHINKNIYQKLQLLFGAIEECIPALNSDQSTPQSRNNLILTIKEITRDFKNHHKLHDHSFWNICSLYYLIDSPSLLIPSIDNLQHFTNYSSEKFFKLEIMLKKDLQEFICNNRYNNSNNSILLDGNYPQTPSAFISPNGSFNSSNMVVAKDLFSSSMKIESWEEIIYWKENSYSYLPKEIAEKYLVFRVYRTIFKNINDFDEQSLTLALKSSVKFIIESVHIFKKSIYNNDGTITDSGRLILEDINRLRNNQRNTRIFQRGVNMFGMPVNFFST
jgi:hypothetical protein